MSDTSTLSILDAARRFGVPVRVLRNAVRSGKLPAPPATGALAALPQHWLLSAEAAIAATPDLLRRAAWPKVSPFARYDGTSAWRKYPNRVRAYNRHRATEG